MAIFNSYFDITRGYLSQLLVSRWVDEPNESVKGPHGLVFEACLRNLPMIQKMENDGKFWKIDLGKMMEKCDVWDFKGIHKFSGKPRYLSS